MDVHVLGVRSAEATCERGGRCNLRLRCPPLSAAVPRRTPACASRRSDDPNDPDRLDARKLTRATLQTLIFGHIDALLPRCSVRLRCDDVGELG